MPKVSLKNRGNGPRSVIDINGKAFVLPYDRTREAPPVEIEVDPVTLKALQEGSEAGGDFEVTSASGGRARMNLGSRETAEQRAAREQAEFEALERAEREQAERNQQQQG
jgi:hypothetical protein